MKWAKHETENAFNDHPIDKNRRRLTERNTIIDSNLRAILRSYNKIMKIDEKYVLIYLHFIVNDLKLYLFT